MRLQLRSSLVKPAKKVIGKQRLTVLVNVSFPAPNSYLQKINHSAFMRWGRFVLYLSHSCEQSYPQLQIFLRKIQTLRQVNSFFITI